MSTTIPALSSVTDILDSDLVMVTHSNGESFKIAGSEINKRNQAVIASGTTITGAPLKTGNIVRVYFTADITGSNTSTGLTLNYNGVNKSVKVPKNGTLANFVASDLGGSPTVYKYLQAHTTLELLYDGTQFIIIGNPVVLSSSDYTIYADGKIAVTTVNTVAANDMHSVTSNAVAGAVSALDVSKADAVSGDNILSIASLEVTSGIGNKNQYVSSITLPAGSRYLVFFYQSSDISDTSRMDGTYVSDAGNFSVVPNSTMGQGNGSVRIAYYKSSSNDRVIRYGLGYKYNNTACTFTWRVNAIRLA